MPYLLFIYFQLQYDEVISGLPKLNLDMHYLQLNYVLRCMNMTMRARVI